ncbi:putative MFS transporter [Xylaria sp. CBS 124048]|nr:putative MFS transporter [Xylaria sp. CBS 124048]
MFTYRIAVLFLLGLLASTAIATSAPLFCKCTCAKNSTLLELSSSATCTHCTHAYCLSQNLPICQSTAEEDVFSTCIQRDSRKDEIIVWGFILGTTGLLGWAAARRINEARRKRAVVGIGMGMDGPGSGLDRGGYAPVPGRG